jgi:molybdopterin-containing oxidoreductase family iron-sulfur binding subunit
MKPRYGMAIDLDRCTGCGACTMACAAENNVSVFPAATSRTGVTPMRVYPVSGSQGQAFIPMPCQHCDSPNSCVAVCPQQAIEYDEGTGIVVQMPQRCFGCRYCITACPYHTRYLNWWDPAWPAGMEKSLSPGVATRMRGVVEKCNLCSARLHAAQEKAAAAGKKEIDMADYVPACVESCPTGAIVFGDLSDPQSAVAKAALSPNAFRMLPKLKMETKVFYLSNRPWVRVLGESPATARPVLGRSGDEKEGTNG